MRLIIEARVESKDAAAQLEPIRLAIIERDDDDLETVGLSLEEGRELMAAVQSAVVSNQAARWLSTQDYCRCCFTPLRHKDSRSVVVRTIFGKVAVHSPRFWSCECGQRTGALRRTVSPLCMALPRRTTPELECLQVKWAAYPPYAAATALLKEVLPLQNCISTTGSKNRIRSAGREIDARIEREISALSEPNPAGDTCESAQVTAVSALELLGTGQPARL